VTLNTKYMFSTGSTEYTFPRLVLGPEASQREVWEAVLAGQGGRGSLVDRFCLARENVMLLAYGQTGTGKTHTLFGPESALASSSPHPDWGLFPRLVDAVLRCMCSGEHAAGKSSFLLTVGAVEFTLASALTC